MTKTSPMKFFTEAEKGVHIQPQAVRDMLDLMETIQQELNGTMKARVAEAFENDIYGSVDRFDAIDLEQHVQILRKIADNLEDEFLA